MYLHVGIPAMPPRQPRRPQSDQEFPLQDHWLTIGDGVVMFPLHTSLASTIIDPPAPSVLVPPGDSSPQEVAHPSQL